MPMDNMGSAMMGDSGDTGSDTSTDTSSDSEMPSVFLSKEQLGGKKCKPGDTLTFKVKDVDPETSGVEAVMEGYDDKSESSDYESDFDKAMPAEGGE